MVKIDDAIWADGQFKIVTFGYEKGRLDFSIAVMRVSELSPRERGELVRLMRHAAELVERNYGECQPHSPAANEGEK